MARRTKKKRVTNWKYYPLVGDICAFCNIRTSNTVDHIAPRSTNKNKRYNTIGCCRTCNELKGDKDLLQFLLWKLDNQSKFFPCNFYESK